MAVKNCFSFFSTLCLISISIHIFVIPFLVEGFTVELVHREHAKSKGNESSESRYEMLHDAFRRSFSRKDFFKAQVSASEKKQSFSTLDSDGSQGQIKSSITNAAGEYLMEVSIGTPPHTFLAIADTGSDLTWTQCVPCMSCYKQDSPLFSPYQSSTYRKLPCDAPLCSETSESGCESSACTYQYSYGDGSFTSGSLSSETFTFGTNSGTNISIPNIAFGCGHQNGGNFNKSGSGLVGLGGGKLSVVNQFGDIVKGKFSYCLIPFAISNARSKISFGTSAVVSGNGTKSTPLHKGTPDTFYFLNLEGISVIDGGRGSSAGSANNSTSNTKRIDVKASGSNNVPGAANGPPRPGNIIIDSGTTLTFLPRQLSNDLEATLRESIPGNSLPDPQGIFKMCYKIGQNTTFPDIVVHFTGADILLPKDYTFMQVSNDLICLTLIGIDDLPIFGNLSQADYLVGYDLVNGTVSFQQTDCSKVV